MTVENFKPNLIDNAPKDGSFDLIETLNKAGNISEYLYSLKKDGCRLQLGLGDKILTRALKEPKSTLVKDRFDDLNKLCLQLNIAIDGEFYMHGAKFNEIFRFFSNEDVTRSSYKVKLEKELKKDPKAFNRNYNNRSIEWLTTFHKELKFWIFDGIVIDRPEVIRFEDRITIIYDRLRTHFAEDKSLVFSYFGRTESTDNLQAEFDKVVKNGWEGLVLTRQDNPYKFGRPSLKQGLMYKMKDDKREYDGVVIGVKEGTQIKEGIARGVNELGRSTTSGKKEDREPNGKIKCFIVQFEDRGVFDVGLRSFNDEAKKFILEHPESVVGKTFVYTAMPPIKDYPRHAYFKHWRDEK